MRFKYVMLRLDHLGVDNGNNHAECSPTATENLLIDRNIFAIHFPATAINKIECSISKSSVHPARYIK